MSAKSFTRLVIVAVAVGFVLAGPATADKKQLQEKLSRNISIELDDVTIAEALETIGQKAELKIGVSEEAVWKLPEGETTRLSVKLEGRLGDSMTEMLSAFFMRYAVADEQITIYPRPELEHIIGRPSTRQLELLKKIYSGRITFSKGFSPEQFNSLIGNFLEASFLPYDMPNNIYQILKASETDKGTSPTTLAILLEQLGEKQRRPHWYISDTGLPNEVPMIKMVLENDFRQAKLDQIVDVSFVDERADVILEKLAGWAGMEISTRNIEPSWLEGKITAKMQNLPLLKALESIAGMVDGAINVSPRDNSLILQGPIGLRKAVTPSKPQKNTTADDGYVGKISIPMDGGRYFLEFMLRQSDLPEELKDFREQMIKEVLGKHVREAKLKEVMIEAIEEAKEKATPEETAEPAPTPPK
jgi:hypothetical protein